MLTRAGLYSVALVVTLIRDIQAVFLLVDTQEAMFAGRLGNYLLAQPVVSRRERLKVTVIGVLYNIAASLGRYIAYIGLSAALVAIRLVLPVIGLVIFLIGEAYMVYNGGQWVIESFRPYASWQLSGIMHILHIAATALLTSIAISLYTAVFLTLSIRYRKTFM